MEIRITNDSHIYRVREKFDGTLMGYGGIARGNVMDLLVVSEEGNKSIVLFSVFEIEIRSFIERGQRGFSLPREVKLRGFNVPKPGRYSILNSYLIADFEALNIIVDVRSTIVHAENKLPVQLV